MCFRGDREGDVEHPDDEEDVQDVVLGEPDALRPKRGGVARDVVGEVGDDGEAEPDPREEQGFVERLFGLAIAAAVDEEECEDAREADDKQKLKRDQKFDGDINTDQQKNGVDRGVCESVDGQPAAKFTCSAGIRDGEQHRVHAPDGDEQIGDLPPTRPEAELAARAFDVVTEGFVTCASKERAESPEQEGDAPPLARALSVLDAEEVRADADGQQAEEVDNDGRARLDEEDGLCAEMKFGIGLDLEPGFGRLRRGIRNRVEASAGGEEDEGEEEREETFHGTVNGIENQAAYLSTSRIFVCWMLRSTSKATFTYKYRIITMYQFFQFCQTA